MTQGPTNGGAIEGKPRTYFNNILISTAQTSSVLASRGLMSLQELFSILNIFQVAGNQLIAVQTLQKIILIQIGFIAQRDKVLCLC